MIKLFTTIELVRNELSKIGPFWWMFWNAGLALIPVALAVLFFKRREQPKRSTSSVGFALQVILILLFLPNAPYVATDLIHFLDKVRGTDISLWHLLATEFPIYVAFVLLGLISYSFTTDRLLFAFKRRFGKAIYRTAIVTIPVLSAIGVYLGRVARFNSWDILQDPLTIARSGKNAFMNPRMVKVILAMSLLLFAVHQFYRIVHDGLRVRLDRNRSRNSARTRLENKVHTAIGSTTTVDVELSESRRTEPASS